MQKKYEKYNSFIKANIPSYVNEALQIFKNKKYEAFIVGGFIRNCIIAKNNNKKLNINKSDVDIATNATPNEVQLIFNNKEWSTIPTGIKHGTITIIAKHNSKYKIEVTTYRLDGSYSDSRHPDNIKFAKNIKEDLSRRDFTMNAIAYRPKAGLYDPYYGICDIEQNKIRTIGSPTDRFTEDALRILRACRFVSTLGFNIDKETRYAIMRLNRDLKNISRERIADELTKLLCGDYVYKSLMMFKRVMCTCIPQISPTIGFDQKTKYHCYDVYEHSAYTVSYMPLDKYKSKVEENTNKKINSVGRWAALLHDIGKPETFSIDDKGIGHFYGHPKISKKIADQVLKDLKFSKKFRKSVTALVRWHDQPTKKSNKSIRKMLKRLSRHKGKINIILQFKVLCDLRIADCKAHAPKYRHDAKDIKEIKKYADKIVKSNEVYSVQQLKINGNDIIEIGVKPGPEISDILNKLTNACINNKVKNNKKSLLHYAKKHYLNKAN